MANVWIQHCKEYQKKNPNMKWGQVLKEAKKSYTKKSMKK